MIPRHVPDLPAGDRDQAHWMLQRLAGGRGIGNLGFAVETDVVLRWWPLREALNRVAGRHAALRTVLDVSGTDLRKRLLRPEVQIPLEVGAIDEQDQSKLISELVGRPMDMSRGPLLRAHLLIRPTGSILVLVLHHLVADARTLQVVMRETLGLYEAFADGVEPPGELTKEVAGRRPLPVTPESVAYWNAQLAGFDAGQTALASTRPVPARPTFAGGRVALSLSDTVTASVSRLREQSRTTENVVLLAGFFLLLARHGAGPDLVVGVPITERRGDADRDAVGNHVNTLPVRVAVDRAESFLDLVRATGAAVFGGLEHADMPYEAMRPDLGGHSADWRVPLFRHAFNFRPPALTDLTVAGRPAAVLPAEHGMTRLDLELLIWSSPTGFDINAVFSTEAHEQDEIIAMLDRYQSMLTAAAERADAPLNAVGADTGRERAVLTAINDTAAEWPDMTLPELVHRQAVADPHRPAVDGWTYGRLVAAAAAVGAELEARGVGPGDFVALYADRGPRLAAAVLGAWWAGAAYLPLDPAHPIVRTNDQLADAGVKVVLAERALPATAAAGREVLDLVDLAVETGVAPKPPRPGDAAYVIYTSGSTGRPKGVVVGHAALANLIRHFVINLPVRPLDIVPWLTTFSFDISALELLAPLVAGGRVVTIPDRVRAEPTRLADALRAASVTIVQATPTVWRGLAREMHGRFQGLVAMCGGEPLTSPLAESLLAEGCRLLNLYGPTETTIWSTAAELVSPVPDRVPVGRPIANTTVHVLGPTGPVPVGVPGELCIGGAGLADGYLGDRTGTARRFMVDSGLGRLYRTGDMVRWRTDGQLEFLGRRDRQVKIRGYRIELGEVVAVLEKHPDIATAEVFAESDPAGHQRLVAAVQPCDNTDDNELALRCHAHAAAWLPAAAVPSRIVVAREFPRTANDKVDLGALRRSLTPSGTDPGEPLPADPTLRAAIQVWRAVLNDGSAGPSTHFFVAGGHSLLAIELADRLSTVIGQPVAFELVFQEPTPARLASRLTGARP